MKAPYLFLYARSHEDPKLMRAGWQAALLWPHVLSQLKLANGVAPDEVMDPEYLSAILRCPVEITSAAVEGLQRVGLLIRASRPLPGGPGGGAREVEGWSTPSWDAWVRDARPTATRRASGAPHANPERAPAVPHGVRTHRARARARGETENKIVPPQAGPPGVSDPGPSRSEMTIAMERVWEAYRRHHPQAGAGTRAGDGGPAGAARKLLRRACQDHDAGALVVLMDYVHTSGEGGPRFLRGENADSRKYLGLDNLLRAEKLPARVEAALAWEARGRQDEAAPSNRGGGGGSREDRLRQIGARVAAEQRAARAAQEEGP